MIEMYSDTKDSDTTNSDLTEIETTNSDLQKLTQQNVIQYIVTQHI